MPKKRSRAISARTQKKNDRARKQESRSRSNVRESERIRDAETRRQQRADPETREIEKETDKLAHQKQRSSPETRAIEQQKNTLAHRKRRSSPETQAAEQQKNTLARRRIREDPTTRAIEQENDTLARRKAREDLITRTVEQDNDRLARRKAREDLITRTMEQQSDKLARRRKREDPIYRTVEQESDKLARQKTREDPIFRTVEQESDTLARRTARKDPTFRTVEQESDTLARKSRRSSLETRDIEMETNSAARKFKRQQLVPWEKRMEQFFENIRDGPMFPCFSCDRLFFKTAIRKVTRDKLISSGCSEVFLEQVLLSKFLDLETYEFCSTCYSNINGKTKKFPRFNINTSMLAFPEIPDVLKELSPLEERLVSPRIIFMKIFALGCDRQYGLRNGVVNVPVDVPRMFDAIPIKPEQSGTIHLKLKRKMQYQSHYIYERIRPAVVFKAAKFLVNTPLYKEHDIKLSETWENENITLFNSDPNEAPMDIDETIEPETVSEEVLYEETMIDSSDIVEFAPGEGQLPLPILMDKYCEELAFPSIFCGQSRTCSPNVKLSYEDHINSEIRRSDRRAVRYDHLLFAHKKSQLKQLCNSINIAMKKAAQSSGLTVSQVLDNNFINDTVGKDNAYRFLTSITGSPAYWEQQKKQVLAMVRQFGVFTLFVTLSAAESHWPELLQILKKTVDNCDDADVSDLNFEEKARLIRSDPVTCALYFDHKFKEIKKTWNNTKDGPFGKYKLKHIYYRIEFQHRGSPHVHSILWLDGAPKFDPNNAETFKTIASFIDEIITTTSGDSETENLVKYQRHKCTHTCKKTAKGKISCRFGAPFPPMDQTRILTPLPDEEREKIDKDESKKIRNDIARINQLLDSDIEIVDFSNFLDLTKFSLDQYIYIVRSQLKANKIFLKRDPKDSRINAYSPKILLLMQSNVDVQFVLDPYACIQYIVDYINKPSRGISRLLRACVESFRNGNHSVREKLKSVSNTFYNGVEISAQEAAWCRLRLPMSCSSVVVEFINTSPKDSRHRILKSPAELKKLEPDSSDVFKKGFIERYAERPKELENICLADFVASYTYRGKGNAVDEENELEDHVIEEIIEDTEQNEIKKSFKIAGGTLTLRKQPKVIRFCKYDLHKDASNFFRERIMLFKPWRNELEEVENINYEDTFMANKELIEENGKKYIAIDLDINEIVKEIEIQRATEENDETDNDNLVSDRDAPETLNVYDFDDNVIQPNVMFELGQENPASIGETKRYTVPDQLPEAEFYSLCDSLNEKQKDYLMHVLNAFKSNELPLYHFISGGAGVGKSRLIKAIFQALIRLYRSEPGPVDSPEILIVAYTGKAAHNVNGITAHHAFSLAMVEGGNYSVSKGLGAEALNSLRVKLSKLKLVIIDEISMLGANTFERINDRLRQVFRPASNQIFGGKSIIAFGDFQQLKPVKDRYVFETGRGDMKELAVPLWRSFKMFELTEIMRQKDDFDFAQALSRLAIGEMTDNDVQMFRGRLFTEATLPEEGRNAIRLTWKNVDVQAYNNSRLNHLKSLDESKKQIVFEAMDSIICAFTETDKKQALHNLKNSTTDKTQGLPSSLVLQIGARYMVTSNIDVSDGLFNGATGVLKFIEFEKGSAKSVFLEFDDSTIGKKTRSIYHEKYKHTSAIQNNWTPIQRIKLTFQITKKASVRVCREMYPLVISEGMTIHKSQGQSMEYVTARIEKGMDRTLMYVVLSRATKLSGLFILGEFNPPKKPDPHHKPTNEMKRLRENELLIPKFTHLRLVPSDVIQIVSHNVQSLRKHLSTVSGDRVFQSSHILLLQESWMTFEKVNIPNKTETQRNNFTGRPTARGTIIFANENFEIENTFEPMSNEYLEQRIDITSCLIKDLLLVNVYKNPKAKTSFMAETLSKILHWFTFPNILICGDFNENFQKEKSVIECFKTYDFELLSSPLESTTNSGSTIDGVFGRLQDYNIETEVYDSYSSYHRPIVIRLQRSNENSSHQLSQSTALSNPLMNLQLE